MNPTKNPFCYEIRKFGSPPDAGAALCPYSASAQPDESGWRELSLIARSAVGVRNWPADEDGLARSEVAKPSALVQRFTDLPIDRYLSIAEGEEKWK